jgi:hypothetical protein
VLHLGLETDMSCLLIISLALAIVLGCYALVAKVERNAVNVLTPVLFFQVPALFVAEAVFIFLFEPGGSAYAYLVCYSIYTVSIAGVALGYLYGRRIRVDRVFPAVSFSLHRIDWWLLVIGLVVYLPIIIEYRNSLSNPRAIYEATRTGYGLNFFLSTVFINLAVIFNLFDFKKIDASQIIFYLTALVVVYLHGSKAQIVTLAFVTLYCFAFVRGSRYKYLRLLKVGGIAAVGIVGLFAVTLSDDGSGDGLLLNIVNYADYTRNSLLVIDDNTLSPQYGRLTLEGAVYSLVPRAIYPDKPENFGVFWLVERYFPERFTNNTGLPAFGIGTFYADFWLFAIPILLVTNFAVGVVMRILVRRLRRRPDVGEFTMLLLLMDLPLIPTGVAVPMVVVYILSFLVYIVQPPRRRQYLLVRRPVVMAARVAADT